MHLHIPISLGYGLNYTSKGWVNNPYNCLLSHLIIHLIIAKCRQSTTDLMTQSLLRRMYTYSLQREKKSLSYKYILHTLFPKVPKYQMSLSRISNFVLLCFVKNIKVLEKENNLLNLSINYLSFGKISNTTFSDLST